MEAHAYAHAFLFFRQIIDLAPDAVECCKLARAVALRLTDDLTADTTCTSNNAQKRVDHGVAGVDVEEGEGGLWYWPKVYISCLL